MARKVNPFIIRLSLNRNWNSVWYTNKSNYSNYLIEDISIRKYIKKFFHKKPLGKVLILKNLIFLNIVFYIKNVSNITKTDIYFLKKNISIFTNKVIYLKFKNIKNHNIDLNIMLFYLLRNIELNKSYRLIIRNIINNSFKFKCLGIKISVQGRINGSVMTRKQIFSHGKIPLQKFCANIKYCKGVALTKYGSIGVKIWLYFGDYIYY